MRCTYLRLNSASSTVQSSQEDVHHVTGTECLSELSAVLALALVCCPGVRGEAG